MIVVLALVGAFSALLIFGLLRDPTRRDDLPSAIVGREAPTFSMPLFGRYRNEFGDSFDLAAARGQPLVINFWASWCPPCRIEMPILEATWKEYKDQVLFVGVNTKERSSAGARNLMDEFGLTYPNGRDANNRINIDYGIFGLPETFFVRSDGTVQYRHAGAVTPEIMNEQLRTLLQEE